MTPSSMSRSVLQHKDRFSYNADLHQLELNDKALSEGDVIEVCVFGHWIPGNVALDSCGWYLITLDQMGIRLREGILARHPCGYLLVESASDAHAA